MANHFFEIQTNPRYPIHQAYFLSANIQLSVQLNSCGSLIELLSF